MLKFQKLVLKIIYIFIWFEPVFTEESDLRLWDKQVYDIINIIILYLVI